MIFEGSCHHTFVCKMDDMSDDVLWKERELEILQLLAEGLTNSEIGLRLHLANNTNR